MSLIRIMLGWSKELPNQGWRKLEIEMDETDLKRILLEAKLEPSLADELPSSMAFAILETETQRLIKAELVKRFPQYYDTPESRQEIADLHRTRNTLLDKLRET